MTALDNNSRPLDLMDSRPPDESVPALKDKIARLEQQLGENERKYQIRNQQFESMATMLRCGYWEWDELAGRAVFYSQQLAIIFGVRHEEMLNIFPDQETFNQVIHPDDLDSYIANTRGTSRRQDELKDYHIFEYRILRPNGQVRYLREQEHGVYEQGKLIASYGVVNDITESHDINEALKQSELRARELFDQLPVGAQEEDYSKIKEVVDRLIEEGITDITSYLLEHPKLVREMAGTTRIVRANGAMAKIHNAESIADFIAEEDNIDSWWGPGWAAYYASEIAAMLAGGFYVQEREDIDINGQRLETRTIVSVVSGYEQSWQRVITIHEDITERKQVELDLIEAKNQAEKSSEAKSEFLSSMSHELRTPLNAILGFSQLFEYDREASQQQLENALEINRAGKHLLSLIDQVLDLARIEAGKMDFSMEAVSLLSVINDGVSWIEPVATTRAISIEIDNRIDPTMNVYADSIRLKQVFLNLLSNAVKYNHAGGRVSIILGTSPGSRIRIGIRDTGPGLSNDKLRELFQPFNRLGAEQGGVEGTGIGLVITRQLVELMNGMLDVESNEGEGSTFWISLEPALASDKPAQPSSIEVCEIKLGESQLNGLRILVAEDNEINQDLMCAQLEVLGYVADFADNGAIALEKWLTGNYDLLLTDVRMPQMDGYQLTREIRKHEHENSAITPIPIIAVTANALAADIKKCYEAGVDDAISKPVELDALGAALDKWSKQSQVEIEEVIECPAIVREEPNDLDLSVLTLSTGDKPELHQKLLQSFLESLPESQESIEAAYAWKNESQVSEHCHKLKSSARSLGAIRLGDICQQLETAGNEKNWDLLDGLRDQLTDQLTRTARAIEAFLQPGESPANVALETVEIHSFVSETNGLENISVLLVDDDYIMHRVTTVILNDLLVSQVSSAMSGQEGLNILQQPDSNIDVVICDLNMPEMDGVEFIRHLASNKYQGSLILTSGEDIRILKTVEKLAIEHNLSILGVLEKPLKPGLICEMLESLEHVTSEGTINMQGGFTVAELSAAIENGELDVHFQPKIEIKSGKVSGLESLVRWNHPKLGLVRPDAFISMAEETGLINPLTDAVCVKTLEYATQLKTLGYELNTAINISVDTLTDLEWPDHVSSLLAASELDPSSVTFEITESRLMEQLSVGLDILSRLSLKRFRLSIDDFGTGYSSMEQLQRIPFSEFKIDRAFVHGVAKDAAARAILESSVMLAKRLEMAIVAEGVEDQQDWDVVEEMGCEYVQGYFISRPLPFDDLLLWLQNWQPQKLKK